MARLVDDEVEVAVSLVQIEVLELRRRRQDDVGVVGRVGHELLVDDREQVLAAKPCEHARLVGRDRRRVGVVDVEGAHGRVVRLRSTASPSCDMLSVRGLGVGIRSGRSSAA